MRVYLRLALLALAAAPGPALAWTFPDSHDEVPRNWSGVVFRLSQDYPAVDPTIATPPSPALYPWLGMDFRTQPAAYVKSIYDYVMEGNREVDWAIQNNRVRAWYHTPWMHYGPNGREFMRGLTRERTTPKPAEPGKGELGPLQTTCFQNWAVGFLNAPGGYVTGQVWADPLAPDPVKSLFPAGTVAAKLLFTAATVDQVPYLANSLEWDANIEDIPPTDATCNKTNGRKVQRVRLLQMDLAVRDPRANSTTGWVFATYTYDGTQPGANWWERMVPVGVMWGNDPNLTQQAFDQGKRVEESWINPDLRTPQHLGWLGRLNGPVDNPTSACLSCHGTAEVPARSPMFPRLNDPNRMRWFQNVPAGNAFDQRSISTDYNLQLSTGIQRFMEWKQAQSGFFAPPLRPAPTPAPQAGQPQPQAAVQPTMGAPTVDADGRDVLMINNERVYRVTRE
jgi:hypothetical protein